MSEEVTLPALGESVTEGTVTRWLKNVGDSIEVDEPLLEVSTDKVDTEVPSPVSGVVEEILVEEDETVEVGAVLARVGDGNSSGSDSGSQDDAESDKAQAQAAEASEQQEEEPAEEASSEPEASNEDSAEVPKSDDEPEDLAEETELEQPSTDQPAEDEEVPASEESKQSAEAKHSLPEQTQATSSSSSTVTIAGYVTPIVRKLARELGVNLDTVTGTGVGGRIRKEDVQAAASQTASSSTAAAAPAGEKKPVEVSELRGTTQKMSRLRKVVSERAVASLQSTAQLTTMVEVDVTRVASLRAAKKEEFLNKTGNKLSFLPFFAVAAAEALQTYPIINATTKDDEIVYPNTENISIAVDTERGLLTPVLRDAATKNISDIAGEIADLAGRTRENKLKPDELSGGTFTLTNTGSRGALFDTPLVFLPQSAILGTGAVVKKPGVVTTPDGTDAIAVRSYVYLALSYDHRIIDGADAARFLTQVKERLEAGAFEEDLGI
ncbi:MAG: 2-oxoglutarate dehydrogenase, E2 component, dihydrolipoamide succinyltransferase [Canibacter sp.]